MNKKVSRLRRATKARAKMHELGATRLVVFRTPRHIYAQVINDESQVKYTGNKEAAALIGKTIAERAVAKEITSVSFDRSGFQYHGRVEALAQAAREAGLKF